MVRIKYFNIYVSQNCFEIITILENAHETINCICERLG